MVSADCFLGPTYTALWFLNTTHSNKTVPTKITTSWWVKPTAPIMLISRHLPAASRSICLYPLYRMTLQSSARVEAGPHLLTRTGK